MVADGDITLEASDGFTLQARVYRGSGPGWVVISGATGVPQRYYEPIASWMRATLGVSVLTFDYRGIGRSTPATLVGFEADYRDWASDAATAIRFAANHGPTVVVGHSFGGQAFGMTDAHTQTRGMYTFATGAGWGGWMPRLERMRVWSLWNIVGPPLVATLGYLPMNALGMGEDLPKGVYADWRKWCKTPRYFFDDPEADFKERFQHVQVPVVGVNSTDDAWSMPASAAAFLSHYPKVELRTVTPDSIGLDAIGHLAYVRPRCQALWSDLGHWVADRLELDRVEVEQTAG